MDGAHYIFQRKVTPVGGELYLLQSMKNANVTNQNSIHEEIKTRLKSANPCYHTVQNLLSSSLLSKSLEIKMYRTILLPVVLCGCETWSLALRKKHKLSYS
jgi:hypothetical protein